MNNQVGLQTSVTNYPNKAFNGLIADGRFGVQKVSAISDEADGGLNLGDLVYVSEFDSQGDVAKVKKMDAANKDKLFGIVVFENRQRIDDTGNVIAQGQDVAVLIRGTVWTNQVKAGIVAGSKCAIDGSDGTFKTVAVTGDVVYDGILALTPSTTVSQLTKIELNLPSGQSTVS